MFIALQRYIVRNLIKPELAPAQDPRALIQGVGRAGVLSAWCDGCLAQRPCRPGDLSADAAVLHHATGVAWQTQPEANEKKP